MATVTDEAVAKYVADKEEDKEESKLEKECEQAKQRLDEIETKRRAYKRKTGLTTDSATVSKSAVSDASAHFLY